MTRTKLHHREHLAHLNLDHLRIGAARASASFAARPSRGGFHIARELHGAMTNARCIVVYTLIVCAIPCLSLASTNPEKVLGNTMYYELDDLVEAAKLMERDAQALEIDVYEVPARNRLPALADTLSDSLSVGLGLARINVRMRGPSFPERLMMEKASSDTAKYVAILIGNRNLSIKEIVALFEADIRILAREQPNVFVLHATAAALEHVNRKDFCGRLEEYMPEMKRGSNWGESPLGLYSVFYFGAEREQFVREMSHIGIEIVYRNRHLHAIDVRGSWEQLQQLQHLWWVRYIMIGVPAGTDVPRRSTGMANDRAVRQFGLNADKALRQNMAANDSRDLVAARIGAGSGANTIVAVRDRSSTLQHSSINGRVMPIYSMISDPSHDTHGIKVSSVAVGAEAVCGSEPIRGIAPAATLLFRPLNENLPTSLGVYWDRGVKIANNSYATITPVSHICDESASLFDNYCYLGGALMVVSTASSDAVDSLATPANAKNALTVGGIKYVNVDLGGAWADSAGAFAPTSLGGPTTDGRLKPELVAPCGDEDSSGFPYHGVVAASTEALTNYCDQYDAYVGTSFSAPFASGVAARVLERSPADAPMMLKAILINTAIPLKGNKSPYVDPVSAMHCGYANRFFGYGLVNAGLINDQSTQRLVKVTSTITTGNSTGSNAFSAPSDAQGQPPVRIVATLVYNDYPNSVGAFSLMDDLDLFLVPGQGQEVASSLPPGISAEGPVEKIIVEDTGNGLPNDWTWRVAFAQGGATYEQTFAVVIDAYYATPGLEIVVDDTLPLSVLPGETRSVTVRVRSTGGTVVGANIGVDVNSPVFLFGMDTATIVEPKFLGNLYDPSTSQHEADFTFTFTAPQQNGLNYITLRADALNREFSEHPVDLEIPVQVGASIGGKIEGSWFCGASEILGSAYDTDGNLFLVGLDGNNFRIGIQKLSCDDTRPLFAPVQSAYWRTLAGNYVRCGFHIGTGRGFVLIVEDGPGTQYLVNVRSDGTYASRLLARSGCDGRAARFVESSGSGVFLVGVDSGTTNVWLGWQAYAEDCATCWREDLGFSVDGTDSRYLSACSDGAGGVYVFGVGHLASGEAGTFAQHFDTDGGHWPDPVNIAPAQMRLKDALASRGASIFVILENNSAHLLTHEGQLPWGSGGRPAPPSGDLCADDCAGGVYFSVPGGQLARYDADFKAIWSKPLGECAGLPIGMMPYRHSYRSDGRGGVCKTFSYLDYVAGEYTGGAQFYDGSGDAVWETCYLESSYDEQQLVPLQPNGKGGEVVWQRLLEWYESEPAKWNVRYRDSVLSFSGLQDSDCTVRGRVLDLAGRASRNCGVVALDSATGAELGRATTDSFGRYAILGIPPFRTVQIGVDEGVDTFPPRYVYLSMVKDEYCEFRMLAQPGNWSQTYNVSPVLGQWRVVNTVGFADFNGDWSLDMYLGYGEAEARYRYTAANELLWNSGNGAFAEMFPPGPTDGCGWTGPTIAASLADIDNDGDQDMYLCNGDQYVPNDPNVLLENVTSSGGTILSRLAYPVIEDPSLGGKAEWVDLNGDRFLDLYVGRPGRAGLVFQGYVSAFDSSVTYTPTSVPGLTDVPSNGFSSWADYNNDGNVDVIVFGMVSETNRILRNNGDWTFTDVTTQLGLAVDILGSSMSGAWGDYDNDGDVDLFMNFSGGAVKCLFRNDGETFGDVTESVYLFSGSAEFAASRTSPSNAVAWSDVDNDGDLDLILAGEPTEVWENRDQGSIFVRAASMDLATPFSPNTLALGDVDRDGDEDLYIGVTQPFSSASGDHSVLYGNLYGDHGNSIGVKLRGYHCNRDGIGATVQVLTAGGNTQTRQLTGMIGGTSPQVKGLTFGIADQHKAQKVQVRWPWGRLTEVPLVPAGATIVVTDEFAAPQAGSIYLTTSSTGERVPPNGSWNLGDYVDFYLAADLSSDPIADVTMGGYEVRVTVPSVLTGLSIEPLIAGVDSNPRTWEFSVRFDQGVPLGAGPVPLIHFHGQITIEGADAAVILEVATPCSFVDPLESVAACWWGGESDVLYRFDGDLASGGIVFPVIDVKPPLVNWCSLYPQYLPSDRSWVAVAFDEPLAESCFDPAFLLSNPSHFRIYNPTNPLITKSILAVTRIINSSNGYLLQLSSPIQAGKLFDLEVTNVSDRRGNVRAVSTINVSLEEDPDIDLNEIFFAMAKSGSNDVTVEWVELRNSESAPICISGWTVANGAGGTMRVPDSPLCVLPPGGHAVLVAAGTDTAGFNDDIVLVCAQTQLAMLDGTLALLSPFGVQTDVFDAGATKDLGKQASCSYQRFAASELKAAVWELDGPEFAPGLHGTPGFANRRLDGSGSESELPTIQRSGLLRATPNPFNPTITIELMLKESGQVRVRVYDIMGRVVRTLLDEHRASSGLMKLVWDGRDSRGASSASGVYFVKMDAPDVDPQSLKITLLR